MEQASAGGGYGKRPIWQWVVIYLIVAAVVYGLVYYFFFAPKGGYQSGTANPTGNEEPQTPSPYNY